MYFLNLVDLFERNCWVRLVELLSFSVKNYTRYIGEKMTKKVIFVLVHEYAEFFQFQKSLKEPILVTTFAESRKTCFFSSLNKWVIDSGAINHMIGNSNMFSSFQPHKTLSLVTVANGSTCIIVGSGTVKPT